MNSFDYLHDERDGLLARILDFRVPERMRGACTAVASVTFFVLSAWMLEAYRLHDALTSQAALQARLDATTAAVARTKVYYDRVVRIVAIDRQVREIVQSGDDRARQLAEIANAIPDHAWLTSIAADGSDIELDGSARDLTTLGLAFRSFARARSLGPPMLVRTESQSPRGRAPLVKYAMRLRGTAP